MEKEIDMKPINKDNFKTDTRGVALVSTNNKSSSSSITGKSNNKGYRRIRKPRHPVNIHYYG